MPLAPSLLTRSLLLLAVLAATAHPAAAQPADALESRVAAALAEAHGEAVPAGLARSVTEMLTEDDKLTAGDANFNNQYGWSVSLSGERALIGSYGEDEATGSAYVFDFDGTAWTETAKLTASDAAQGDFFGYYVSLSGDRALVGAIFEECTSGNDCGAAYVFDFDGTAWTETAKLTANDAAQRAQFGRSVSLSGDRAIVGAPFSSSGAAYVFAFDGTAWAQTAKLTASDAAGGDDFGFAVSLSGDRALIGAKSDSDGVFSSGAAYIFELDGTAWTETAKLIASDAATGDDFGFAVSLSGDRALIGAYRDDDNGDRSGAAYVFELDGTAWTETAKLTASDAAGDDRFGYSVSLSDDRALVGATRDSDGGPESGAAYVFELDGTAWTETAKLIASDAAQFDNFGWSVSLLGDRALVGSPQDGDGNSGSAYVFDLSPPVACAAGTFSDDGFEPCMPAPPGTFVATEGATAATPCDPGTFQPDEGQTACLPAPPGTFVATSGAIQATDCALGTFQPDAGQTACLLAPIGFYVDTTGATMATACPDGQTTKSEGSTSIEACFDPTPMSFDLTALNTDPAGSPIVTPQGSGVAFDYTITNNTANPTEGDFWFTAEREGTTVARSVIRSGMIAPTTTLSSSFVQGVPGASPVGTYTYTLNIGLFPDFIADADTFTVEVTAGSGVAGGAETWSVTEVAPWSESTSPEAASSEAMPETFALEAAYPNPFAEQAVIGYAVPEAAEVRLVVYDLLGRTVAVLAEGRVEAGRYEAVLDGAALPSGTYLVRLDAGGTVQTQRLTLVR